MLTTHPEKTPFIVCTMICQRVLTAHELFAKGKNKFPDGFTGWAVHFSKFSNRTLEVNAATLVLSLGTYLGLGCGESINFYCGLWGNANEGSNFFFLRFTG